MSNRYPTPEELEASDAEKQAARTAASAQGTDAAWGGGIGTVAGGALGALLSIPSFGTLAPMLVPAGMTAGGALGGAIGGQVGGDEAKKASDVVAGDEAERARKVEELQLREEALNRLVNRAGG